MGAPFLARCRATSTSRASLAVAPGSLARMARATTSSGNSRTLTCWDSCRKTESTRPIPRRLAIRVKAWASRENVAGSMLLSLPPPTLSRNADGVTMIAALVEELVERAERRVTARLPSRALKTYYDAE
jgi:hypothetical protein